MRKQPVQKRHHPLPLKPLQCSLCTFISTLGQNDLQLHMDKEHKGWVEGVIRKLDIQEKA